MTAAGYNDSSERAVCLIIKVELRAVIFLAPFFTGNFDQAAARSLSRRVGVSGKPHAPKRNIVKLLDGLIFASA